MNLKNVGDKVMISMRNDEDYSIWPCNWYSVMQTVWDSVRKSVWNSMTNSVRDSVDFRLTEPIRQERVQG
jgi:hypothetical protein